MSADPKVLPYGLGESEIVTPIYRGYYVCPRQIPRNRGFNLKLLTGYGFLTNAFSAAGFGILN
jgi:hypothetical protein